MSKPVRILFVEDSEDDARLALRELRKGGFEPAYRRVQTAAELEAALEHEVWDAVISDFAMPGFTGLDALRIVRATGLDIPFILTSGAIGEATAVEAIKTGASDYIMKGSLALLPQALARELEQTGDRAAHLLSQRDLIASELRFRQMAESIDDVFFLQNLDSSEMYYVSPAYETIWGRTCDSLYANPASWGDSIHPEDLERAIASYDAGRLTGFDHEFRIVRPDGELRWIQVRGFPIADGDGQPYRIAGVATDITERKLAESKIKRLNRVYAVLSGINTLIVRVQDREELFRESCRIACEAGQLRSAWIGIVNPDTQTIDGAAWAGEGYGHLLDHLALAGPTDDNPARPGLAASAIRTRQYQVCNDIAATPERLTYPKEALARGHLAMISLPLFLDNEAMGAVSLYAGESNFFDDKEIALLDELAGNISFAIDHLRRREELNTLAYYDTLTGLANRNLFLARAAQHLSDAARDGHKLAMYLIDLERFKNINDSLGRPAGDALLKQVAEWLTRNGGGDASLFARLDADHFAAILPRPSPEWDLRRLLATTTRNFLEHPFSLTGSVFRVAAKVGAAVFPADGSDVDTLFKHAEAALKKAKKSGERFLFYTQAMTDNVAGRVILENRLRHALDNDEFVLHYQPRINLVSGKVSGAEALIRWNDPSSGLVAPEQFIPVLEEIGLSFEVGRWAMQKVIADYLSWRKTGLAGVRLAVNMSPQQLRNPGFVAEIRRAVSIDPHAAEGLELEITESLIMEDVDHNIVTLWAVREMGVHIAIDNFGAGFSSLSHLSRFPVSALKIDPSFVNDMNAGPQGLALVSTIINLAHSLKLKVVAEGVETEEQSRLLRLLRCDEMQGSSQPVPRDEFEAKFKAPSETGRQANERMLQAATGPHPLFRGR
jgi:diguanylate cyclase (GGDEF)-like protein/PAS domain S-box-containing protein